MQLYAIVKNVKTEAETMRNEAVFLGATNVQVLDRGLELIALLASADAETVCVACGDIGAFAVFYPNGRK